ncbi:MAG TPA: hypothetical protein VHL57_06805, partial [Flavobacteriales bacterium]|nr:hypothetical protein [Flavobacteriales bacterium]
MTRRVVVRSVLVALLVGRAPCALPQWHPLASGTPVQLNSIFFRDAVNGYCVGGGGRVGTPSGDGVVLRTTDGGNTWSTVHTWPDVALIEVVAVHDTVIVYGRATSFSLRCLSTDGGATWHRDTITYRPFETTVDQGRVYFIDEATGGLYRSEGKGVQLVRANAWHFEARNGRLTVLGPVGAGIGLAWSDDGTNWKTTKVDVPDLSSRRMSHATVSRNGDTLAFKCTFPSTTVFSTDGGATWASNGNAPELASIMLGPRVQFGTGP